MLAAGLLLLGLANGENLQPPEPVRQLTSNGRLIRGCFVLGIDTDEKLAYVNNLGEEWQDMGGQLMYASATGNSLWGINNKNQIYKRNGSNPWELVEGPKNSLPKTIAAAGAQTWITDVDGKVYKYKPKQKSWVKIPAEPVAKQIALSWDRAWMIDADGGIWHAPVAGTSQKWKQISGNLDYISVLGNDLWGVNSAQDIYQWASWPEGGWAKVNGKLSQLSVATGYVFGVNSANVMYRKKIGEDGWDEVGKGYIFAATNGYCVPAEELEDLPECFTNGKKFEGSMLTQLKNVASPQQCMAKCERYSGGKCKAMTWEGYEMTCDLFKNTDGMSNAPFYQHMISASIAECNPPEPTPRPSPSPTPRPTTPTPPVDQSMADRSLCWDLDMKLTGGINVDTGDCEPRYTTKNCECRKEWYDPTWNHHEHDYCVNSAQGEYCYVKSASCEGQYWGWCKKCEGGTGVVDADSMEKCVEECEEHRTCNYVSFWGHRKKCELKQSYTTAIAQDEDEKWESGPLTCNRCYSDGYKYKDSAWKKIDDVNNYDACRYQCDLKQECKYFSWHKKNKWCKLYKSISANKRAKAGRVITAKRGCQMTEDEYRAVMASEEFALNPTVIAVVGGVSLVGVFGILYALRAKGKYQAVETENSKAPLLSA